MKAVIAAALVAVVGVPVWLVVSGGGLGISDEHPLGRLSQIEAWFADRELVKEPVPEKRRKDDEPAMKDLDAWQFTNPERTRLQNVPHRVYVYVDDGGTVRFVTAFFWSGDDEVREAWSKVEGFIGKLWVAIAGARPVFVDKKDGSGRLALHYREADIEKGAVRARWTKSYQENARKKSIFDNVIFRVTR